MNLNEAFEQRVTSLRSVIRTIETQKPLPE
jgi:hypothetical protein